MNIFGSNKKKEENSKMPESKKTAADTFEEKLTDKFRAEIKEAIKDKADILMVEKIRDEQNLRIEVLANLIATLQPAAKKKPTLGEKIKAFLVANLGRDLTVVEIIRNTIEESKEDGKAVSTEAMQLVGTELSRIQDDETGEYELASFGNNKWRLQPKPKPAPVTESQK